MASNIDQLIALLDGALRDHDAGNGPMPHSRLTEALALAEAADDEHRAQVRELRTDVEAAKGQAEHDAEHRGWLRGYEWNGAERNKMRDERKKLLAEQSAKLDALGKKDGVTPETLTAIREALGII